MNKQLNKNTIRKVMGGKEVPKNPPPPPPPPTLISNPSVELKK